MKISLKLSLFVSILYVLINYSWVHAASVAALSSSCDEATVKSSRALVSKFYGSVTSNPIIRCPHQKTLGLDVRYGQTNFALGLNPVILIGPDGANVDVVAHEWGHAELFQRVGTVHRTFRIPVWLDEGLAMQLDHRPHYNQQALVAFQAREDLNTPSLVSLASSDFFVAGSQGAYHYAYSKCVVSRWVARNHDWLDQIKAIKDGPPAATLEAAESCNS